MSRLCDVIIVLGDFDHERSRIPRYLDSLSSDYGIVHIDNTFIAELKAGELPQDILAASICDLVLSQHPGKAFRFLIEAKQVVTGFVVARHLIGRDLNVEFMGVFGATEWNGFNALSNNEPGDWSFPIHYISESSLQSNTPSHWCICDIALLDEAEAYVQFCAVLNRPKGFVFPELSYQPLFSIQNSRGNNTPIFCIPGAGDNIASFTAMSMALGGEHSIYGMQPRGLDGRMTPHYSVEAAASNYIESIRKVQKRGPIHLVGHSFGGWVAFEIATIITHSRDLGLSVESLTIIDSEVPGTIKQASEYSDKQIVENYVESIELYSKKCLSIRLDDWLDISFGERIRRLHEAIISIGILPARSTADILRGPYNTFTTAFRTLYSPRHRYAGEIRLVLAPDEKLTPEKNQQEYLHISNGWKKYARELTVFCGGGNHIKVLSEPYINEVIEWWKLQNQDAGSHSLSAASLHAASHQLKSYAVG